jgi:alanyl-tRNA synthetase
MTMCAVLGAMMVIGPLRAQDGKPAAPAAPAAADNKDDTFAVLHIYLPQSNGFSIETFEVCKKSGIEARKKVMDKANKEELEQFEKAKKDAAAAKKKYNEVPPKPQTCKVVVDNLKTEAEAKVLAEKEKKKVMNFGDFKPGEKPAAKPPAAKPKGG